MDVACEQLFGMELSMDQVKDLVKNTKF
jgi:hypothetical protein